MVSTPLKHISQTGNLPQIGMKINKYLKPPPRLENFWIIFVDPEINSKMFPPENSNSAWGKLDDSISVRDQLAGGKPDPVLEASSEGRFS